MKSTTRFHICCCIFLIMCGVMGTQQAQQGMPQWLVEECEVLQSPISKVVNVLSSQLASVIQDRDNFFFSPFCISVALGMTYLGARGSTAREMEKALGYDLLPIHGNDNVTTVSAAVHSAIHDELHSFENHNEDFSMLVANAIFKQQGYEVRSDFIKDLKSIYTANVRDADFASNGERAVLEINEWVKNNTKSKIDHLFEEPLDPLTRLVLLNAIYFKGLWEQPFDEDRTRPKPFYRADGSERQALFMIAQRKFNYFEDGETGYSFLEIDYKGDHISMILMLPNDIGAFPNLEVTNDLLCRVRFNFISEMVLVYVPKFHMEFTRNLVNDMKSLGVVELFTEGVANLTGMSSSNDLYVSMIQHKAVIDVHEKGTVAAAVSGVVVTSRSGFSRAMPIFRANHPFLFCILDKRSGAILFIGRVVDP